MIKYQKQKVAMAIKRSFKNIKLQFSIAKELSNEGFKYKEIIKILIMGINSPSLRQFKVRAAAAVEYKKKHKENYSRQENGY